MLVVNKRMLLKKKLNHNKIERPVCEPIYTTPGYTNRITQWESPQGKIGNPPSVALHIHIHTAFGQMEFTSARTDGCWAVYKRAGAKKKKKS